MPGLQVYIEGHQHSAAVGKSGHRLSVATTHSELMLARGQFDLVLALRSAIDGPDAHVDMGADVKAGPEGRMRRHHPRFALRLQLPHLLWGGGRDGVACAEQTEEREDGKS